MYFLKFRNFGENQYFLMEKSLFSDKYYLYFVNTDNLKNCYLGEYNRYKAAGFFRDCKPDMMIELISYNHGRIN